MELYRGDYIKNTSEPGRYRFDGIRSKSFGKGKPAYIQADILLTSIRQHIHPLTEVDHMIYKASEFISFSSLESKGLFWLKDQGSISVDEISIPYYETRYLFKLEIDESEMISLDKHRTMFRYNFACNTSLKRPNSSSLIESMLFEATEEGTFFKHCPICNCTTKNHAIVLINSSEYLNCYKNTNLFEGAIINAENDREWLVLPIDTSIDLTGTTIPRANFWNVKLYVGKGETRDPELYAMLGIDGND